MVDTVLASIFPLQGLNKLSSSDGKSNSKQNTFELYLNNLTNFKQSMIIIGTESW